jgi:hypothetical protein
VGDLGQERENGEGDDEIIPSKLEPSPLQLKPRQLPGRQTGRPAYPEQRVGRQNLRLDRMSFVAPGEKRHQMLPVDAVRGCELRQIEKVSQIDQAAPVVAILELIMQDQEDDLGKGRRNADVSSIEGDPAAVPIQPFDVAEGGRPFRPALKIDAPSIRRPLQDCRQMEFGVSRP